MATVLSLSLLQAATTAAAVSETYWGLKPGEWITIVAILLGPIFAVITQFVWQKLRKDRDSKQWVFSTLMTLRGSAIVPDYVKALNFIDVVFYKNEDVREKWKKLLTYLSSDAYKATPVLQSTLEHTRDLQAELLVEMAKDLGYDYDFTHIKENGYYPQALVTTDNDNFVLRKLLIAAFDKKGALSVRAVEDAPEETVKMRQKLMAVFEGETPLKVKLVEEEDPPALASEAIGTPIVGPKK